MTFPSFRRPAGAVRVLALAVLALAAPRSAEALTEGLFDLKTVEGLLEKAQPGETWVAVGDMRFRVTDLQRQRERLLDVKNPRAPRSAVTPNVSKWPGGRVPYRFAASVNATQQAQFLAACRQWEAVANVRFVPATTEANYVNVISGNGNYSYVGMIGGSQELSMYNWSYQYIICHELAHALGVWHEQMRSDRDTYVSILTQNIITGYEHNFTKLTTTNLRAYDFDSIMHYPATAFTRNGQPTIVAKPAYVNAARSMGQRSQLSPLDIQGMIDLYGATGVIPRVALSGGVKIEDAGTGNNNGRADRGETVALKINVRNSGTASATACTARVATTSPYVTVANDTAALGTLAIGGNVTSQNLRITVSPNAPIGHVASLTLTFTAEEGAWVSPTSIAIAQVDAPIITPGGGTFTRPPRVTMTTATPGLPIYYTIDGTTPTFASPLYDGAFELSQTAVVRAITETDDGTPSPVSVASFLVAKPVVPFDTVLTFSENATPATWTLDVDSRLDRLNLNAGAFEVAGSEGFAALQRDLPLPSAAYGLRVGFTASLSDGGTSAVTLRLLTAGGSAMEITLGRNATTGGATVSVAPDATPLVDEPLSPGDYRLDAQVAGGTLTISATPVGSSAPAFSHSLAASFDPRQITAIRLAAATDGAATRLDDVAITARYAAVTPRPPTTPKLTSVRAASANSLLVNFVGEDAVTLTYKLEVRSQARGKWSRWKTARAVTPRRTNAYSTAIVVPKAERHQVRVTAENSGGKATSRILSVSVPRASRR